MHTNRQTDRQRTDRQRTDRQTDPPTYGASLESGAQPLLEVFPHHLQTTLLLRPNGSDMTSQVMVVSGHRTKWIRRG